MKEFVERHTMFPYYARFIKKERREKALHSMMTMDGNYYNLLPISKGVTDRCLRYCPICAKEDSVTKGETYWHRIKEKENNYCSPIYTFVLDKYYFLFRLPFFVFLIFFESSFTYMICSISVA